MRRGSEAGPGGGGPPRWPPRLRSRLLSGALASAAEAEAAAEWVEHVSRLLARLPAPVLVVLRYLFAFLNQ